MINAKTFVLSQIGGLAFGLAIGGIMRLPGADAVDAAMAINLCVMTSIWLGIAIANVDSRQQTLYALGVSTLTFVIAATALRTNYVWLYSGFLLQAFWSVDHARKSPRTVLAPMWYALFSAWANIGFAISLYLITSFLP